MDKIKLNKRRQTAESYALNRRQNSRICKTCPLLINKPSDEVLQLVCNKVCTYIYLKGFNCGVFYEL